MWQPLTTPQPIFPPTGPRSVQTLRHPMIHLPAMRRANCETLKTIVAFAMLSAVRGRNVFKRLGFGDKCCYCCFSLLLLLLEHTQDTPE